VTKSGGFWRYGAIGALLVLAGLLLVVPLPWRHASANQGTSAGATANSSVGTRATTTSTGGQTDATRIMIITARGDTFGACEQRLKQAYRNAPTAAILGASYTAGVGPDRSSLAWSVLLARKLGWNAVIYGDSGAGYVSTGSARRGPVLRMLDRVGLRGLDPSLVLLQFGHDDIGVPAATERAAVERAIATIRREAPKARVALITVFASPGSQTAARSTDRVIVSAARTADPKAIIIDPLTGHWLYQRAHRGALHPSAAGDRWIEQKVAGILRAHGIRGARSGGGTIICDSPIGIPVAHRQARRQSRPQAHPQPRPQVHPRTV
jgi:lysophospholipase L1-like esterase